MNFALLVFGLITVCVLGSLLMALLFGWIAYAIFKRIRRAIVDTPTDKQIIQDEGATNVIPECLLIPEDEKGMEDAPELEYCVHELLDVVVPIKDTISQSKPIPPSSEETSPAVIHNEPNDIPQLAQNKDESSVAHNIVQKSTDKEESMRVAPTDLMTTHSSNAAKSFQKLLQFAMSQDPSETYISATSTQVEAATDSSPEQTDETTGSVARNQQRSKGQGKKKKNKRNKGRNGKN
jgi:uncharacterized membrane protein YraQ (UPF0718 family)